MALQYQTVSIKDFGAGIDQQSSENQLAEGFCEDLRNCDPKPEGYLAKRPGYEGSGGDLPLRVKQIDYENNLLCFTFDRGINLSQTRSSPLVVHGQHSQDNGDFDKDFFTTQYYSSFSLISTKTPIAAGATSPNDEVTISLDDQDSLVYYARSTSLIDNSNELVWPNTNILNNTPEATGTITNSTAATINIFAYETTADYADNHATTTVGSFERIVIPAGTHALDDFSIETKVYEISGPDYIEVVPEFISVDQLTREVIIDLDAPAGTYRVMLKQLPIENVASGTVGAFSSNSVTVTGLTGDFPYFTIFLSEAGNDDLEVVQPDNIVVDAVTNEALITFTNNSPVGATFNIYYDFAEVQVNKICVTPNAAYPGDSVSTDINLTVWGIKQDEAYVGSSAARPGWVNHIDSYRAPAGSHLVAGLGGNLFREAQRTETRNFVSTYGADYLIPLLYPDMRARLASQIDIGPVFYQSTETPIRTRGFITADNLTGSHRASVESIIWQGGTTVRYTLNVANHTIDYSGGGPIETTAGFEDILTVESTNYSQFNGAFNILAWGIVDANQIYIDVDNTAVTDGDFDVLGDSAGSAAIYTDNFPLNTDSEFLEGDTLQSDFFDGTQIYLIEGTDSAGTAIKVSGITSPKNLPAGLRITARRTSSVIPLRNAAISNNDSVLNFVRGDMIKYTDYERKFEVIYINALDDTSVDITVSGGTATATMATNDTAGLAIGQKVLFVRAGNFDGLQTVTAITDTNKFEFETSNAAGFTGAIMKGKTIEIDESVTVEDSVENTKTMQVLSRWIPIELPISSAAGTLTPIRKITYFESNDFDDQAFLRSSMVSNNMYFTDGDDAVMKYDGANIYRAGLFRWQPQLFVATDTTPTAPTGTISFSSNQIEVVGIEGAAGAEVTFKVPRGQENIFSVGDKIRHKDDSGNIQEFEVKDTNNEDPNDGHVIVDEIITGAANGDLQKRNLFRYYFRLNAVDANDNLLASAVTGADDYVIELYESTQVKIRLVGMPIWDIYDYDRLEVEVYRTKANDATNYFHIVTIPMDFTDTYGYIDFQDTDSDIVLNDFDIINVALKGAELGTQFSEPLRAKYLTSAGNRLILGNLKDYPELDIRLFDTGPRIDIAALTGDQWQFRRDSTSIATGTDLTVSSELQLEFVNSSSAATITSVPGTSFTITELDAANFTGWVYLFHSASADGDDLDFSGWWYAVDGTVTWSGALAVAGLQLPDQYATASSGDIVPVFLGEDGNYSTANGNFLIDTTEGYQQQAVRRMANAINTVMRYSSDPWLIANAGNEFQAGQLLVRSPKVLTTTPEVVLPNFSGFNIFVNNIKRGPTTLLGDPSQESAVSAEATIYPSRLIASAQNYAEIFDNPRAILDTDSFSAVDVNSADGQEITGIIPFFGDSAFGSAQKDSVIVVFKENSIYLVNLAAKAQGLNAVQKVESQGLGCTAPYSIASTRDGIMFANESGMFRLTRDLRIEYIGQKMERVWQDGEVNLDQLAIAQGTHYAIGRQYKLSVPRNLETVNSEVMVYNHTREYRGKGFGSWTIYDNHPATGWANLQTDAFFGSALGRVFRLRNEGSETDYRDGAAAYTMSATMRAMDFGDSARRKSISKVFVQFRVADDQTETTFSSAPDLGNDFTEMDSFTVSKDVPTDGLSDEQGRKVKTIGFSPDRRKLVYFQLKLENTTKDEIVEIAGIDIRVAGLTDEGITQAKRTVNED